MPLLSDIIITSITYGYIQIKNHVTMKIRYYNSVSCAYMQLMCWKNLRFKNISEQISQYLNSICVFWWLQIKQNYDINDHYVQNIICYIKHRLTKKSKPSNMLLWFKFQIKSNKMLQKFASRFFFGEWYIYIMPNSTYLQKHTWAWAVLAINVHFISFKRETFTERKHISSN